MSTQSDTDTQITCPSCGTTFVTAWPQCPICSAPLDGVAATRGSGPPSDSAITKPLEIPPSHHPAATGLGTPSALDEDFRVPADDEQPSSFDRPLTPGPRPPSDTYEPSSSMMWAEASTHGALDDDEEADPPRGSGSSLGSGYDSFPPAPHTPGLDGHRSDSVAGDEPGIDDLVGGFGDLFGEQNLEAEIETPDVPDVDPPLPELARAEPAQSDPESYAAPRPDGFGGFADFSDLEVPDVDASTEIRTHEPLGDRAPDQPTPGDDPTFEAPGFDTEVDELEAETSENDLGEDSEDNSQDDQEDSFSRKLLDEEECPTERATRSTVLLLTVPLLLLAGLGVGLVAIGFLPLPNLGPAEPAVTAEAEPTAPAPEPDSAKVRQAEMERWAGELGHGDMVVASRAAANLAKQGTAAVPVLVQRLESPGRSKDRQRAAAVLTEIGPDALPAFPAMVQALDGSDPALRNALREGLVALGPNAVGPIAEALRESPSPVTRLTLLEVLVGLGPAASESADAIAEAVVSGSAQVQALGLQGLRAMGPASSQALGRVVQEGSSAARKEACRILNEWGPEAEPALPALVAALADGPNDTKGFAAATLVRIGDASAVPLVEMLETLGERPGDKTAELAAKALGHIGEAALAPLMALVERAERPSSWYAATALGKMGGVAIPALPTLEVASRSNDSTLKYYAVEAIREIRSP